MIAAIFSSLFGNQEHTCICGSKLELIAVKYTYGDCNSTECNKCRGEITGDTNIYHCNNSNTYKHITGYNVCQSCISLPLSFKIQTLSLLKRQELLSEGYIRELSNNLSPKSIRNEIIKCIPHMFIKFDVCHKDNNICINNNGIKRTEISFLLTAQQIEIMSDRMNIRSYGRTNIGVFPYQKATVLFGSSCYFGIGIHEWSFEVSPLPVPKSHHVWFNDKWGVTDDINICSQYNNQSYTSDVEKHIFAFNYGGYDITKTEIIKIILNCDDNTLTLYRNNWKKKTIKIQPNCMYYPLIVSSSNNIAYNLLDE